MSKRILGNVKTIVAVAVMTLGVVGSSSQASASIIFNNGPPVDGAGTASPSDDFPVNGDFQSADDFELELTPFEVTSIFWFGTYGEFSNGSPAAPDAFTLRIHDDDMGLPDASDFTEVLAGTLVRIPTGFTDGDGFYIYKYWVEIAPVVVDADTRYWLSIVNDAASGGGAPWAWATAPGSPNVPNSAITVDGGDWQTFGFNLAFGLGGAPIPEPSAALAFGIGCLFVGGATRRGGRR